MQDLGIIRVERFSLIKPLQGLVVLCVAEVNHTEIHKHFQVVWVFRVH